MTDNAVDLEEAFRLIQQGTDFVAVDAHWEAAEAYDNAREILQQLAIEAGSKQGNAEQQKIATLYQSQSREYLHQARASLLAAMKEENKSDAATKDGSVHEPSYLTLSDEDAEKRLRVFARLFSRELQLSSAAVDDETPVLELSSLENRLSQLNASLPSGFKTSNERMSDINRGLNRLGLSLYSAADEQKNTLPQKSESDQVADIIAQAKDEIAMQPAPTTTVSTSSEGLMLDEDALLLMDEEEESEHDDSDDDINNEMHVEDVEAIREKIVDAQAKLAEIVALLDIDEEAESDGAGHVTIKDQGPGKKALRQARILLQQAGKVWAER